MMFIVLATGTIATVSHEIDYLIFEPLRASPPPQVEHSLEVTGDDWSAIYASIKSAYPSGEVRYLTSLGNHYLTYRALVDHPDLTHHYVQIDPWTHNITGVVPQLTVQRFFRDFHRYLFMPAFPGIIIVCLLAFVLGFSLYSGIKTTRNKAVVLRRIRIDKGIRVLLSDIHKFIGLWSIWFSRVIAATGCWYLYEFGFQVAKTSLEPRAPKIDRPEMKDETPASQLSADRFTALASIAQTAHKDWEITSIVFPNKNKQPLQFRGVSGNPLLRDRAYRVFVDPTTMDVVSVFTPSSIGANAYLNEYIDPLHFGSFGGLSSKLVWFIFGLGLTSLSITGVMMTWQRTRSKALSSVQIATLPIILLIIIAFLFWVQRYL